MSVELLDIVLWCAQEAGVLLAVGAALAVMVGYVFATRDGVVTDKEARYSKNSHRAIDLGLAFIILSGLAITVLHISLGQTDIVFEPIFLFKWLLIVALTVAYVAQRKKTYGSALFEGMMGGTWVALFLLHSIAPLVGWLMLLALFAGEIVVFLAVWMTIVKLIKKPDAKPVQAPKPVAPAVTQPVTKPAPVISAQPVRVQPLVQQAAIKAVPVAPAPSPAMVQPKPPPIPSPAPIVPPAPKPQAPVAVAPAPKKDDAHHSLFLPALHFMPKSEEQLKDRSHILPLGAFNRAA